MSEIQNPDWQTTAKIVGELRKLLKAQTREQKAELRKSLLESLARKRRTLHI
jgi:hypothetical protein